MAYRIGSKPIVTEGLIFCVDAKDKHSYSGSGTAVIDLATGIEGTLTGGKLHI